LLANKEIIVSTFENHNHKNIRTLIFALISFETIYNIVSKLEFEPTEILDRQLQNILNYLIEIAIRLKCNQELYCWKEINKPAAKIFSKYEDIFGNNMWGYKFVDTYLMTQFIDEDEIKDIMFDVLNEVKKEEDNKYLLNSDSITELSNWTHLEDERIKSLINTIVMEIKENKYPPLYFKNLIGLLMQLEDAGFEISYDEVIPSMQSYLKNSKETVTVDDLSIFGSDYNTTKKYKSITKPLIDIVIRKDVESKKIINDCLNLTKLWGKTFAENCKNNREGYLLDKKFFYYLDVKKIIEKLSISTVEDVYDFISGINTIYNFSNLSEFFRNDIEKITLFLKLLDIESLSSSKITKKIALTTLKSKLEKIKKTIES